MPGPTKHDYGDELGKLTQSNFRFLTELWDPNTGPALRNTLLNQPNLASLVAFLGGKNIVVDPGVFVMVVDIQNAKVKYYVPPDFADGNPNGKDFYAVVLPPAPIGRGNPRSAPKEYKAVQQWLTAHYHAVNDSYGM